MNIVELYEDLKKYTEVSPQCDDLFYDAPEGDAQIDIVKEILKNIIDKL